ncbi:kinase-like domain-containing protein [Thelephora terrestris]|uniref:Kinase-like domain-containing protein n=1 Tax=Thelephora terrestris TaxID=56493 RepID=A0A9P6L739_9AGAM|nr:kinase-like domain-containing protein [Thelephora terrestris]
MSNRTVLKRGSASFNPGRATASHSKNLRTRILAAFTPPHVPSIRGRTFSIFKPSSPQEIPGQLQEAPTTVKQAQSSFQEDLKAIDPKVLANAMGGGDQPPEEPLFSSFEKGHGYFTSAAVGRSLNRYEFARKLGWAGSSSVWLALDTSTKARTYVAIKILTSQATARIVCANSIEYDAYRKIENTNPQSPGFNHCLTLRHCFTAYSEAGGHLCFVTDPLSSSLATLRPSGQNRYTLPVAKRIIKQVLLALDYLHRECGYIHTDLKSENILVTIPPPETSRIDEYIKSHPAEIYGPPLPLKSLALPLVFSRSTPLPYLDLGGSLEDISLRVVDYSEVTTVDNPRRDGFCQPPILRAPEVTLKYPWTSAIDIWTVGCLLFELLTEYHLFGQESGSYSNDLHLRLIVECLGPFPLEFLQACEDRNKYFDKNGMLLQTIDNSTPLEDFLRSLAVVDESDIPGVAAFLRRCLTLDPKLRPSTQELLKDSWLM